MQSESQSGNISQAMQFGLEHHRAGRLPEAERIYEGVLHVDPNNSVALHLLGVIAHQVGKNEIAVRLIDQALTLKPAYAEALSNRGLALQELKRHEEALASYDQALAIKPGFAEALANRGNVLQDLKRYDEALASHDQALTIKPGDANTLYSRGLALRNLGRWEEAAQSFHHALSIKPNYIEAHFAWVHQRQHLCAWSDLEREVEALRQRIAESKLGGISPFSFLALPDTTAIEQRACASQFAEKNYPEFFSRRPIFETASRRATTKLRIGYLSADFYSHATSSLLAEVIELHDRNRFAVVAYSYGENDGSPMHGRMRAAFDEFHDIRLVPHESAARRIAHDEIDILVDLKGYTTDTRMEIPALRPAPVQISWLGYPGTLGHRRLADYLIGDPIVSPLEHAAQYSETLALMPRCYQPNDRQRVVGPRPSRKDMGLPEKGFVFCCFNQSYKITAAIFDLWCRLLAAVPGSLLWMLEMNPAAANNLLREAEARAVTAERIVFGPRLPPREHLGRVQLADLALDTYPVTSHTTASDVLWAGVPLITRIGETFASRVAASILHAAGLPNLVTHDLESYYRLALALATNPEQLAGIRADLAANRLECPLFDSEHFTRDLERLYEKIWSNYRAGKAEHIVLAS